MPQNQPFVSVIMSVKDGEAYLRQAIDSILNQTYTHFEFIIVNDGSTDGTAEILKSYTDPRIQIITNSKNLGISKSFNKAIKKAKGTYIARMDADDEISHTRFTKQVAYMEKYANCVALGTRYRLMTKEGRVYRKAYTPCGNHELQFMLLFTFPFCHPSLMLRHSTLKKHHILYDEKFKVAEDYSFMIQVAQHGEIASLPDYLFCYRTHSGGISKTRKNELVQNFMQQALPVFEEKLPQHNIPKEELVRFVEIFNARIPLTTTAEIQHFTGLFSKLIKAYKIQHHLTVKETCQLKITIGEVLFKKIILKDKNFKKPLNILRYIFDRNSLFFYFVLGIPQIMVKMYR